jgi:hypothetical protein
MVNARFEFLTAEPMKTELFWNLTPYRLVHSYRLTWSNIPRDLNIYANQEIPRLTPNPEICYLHATRFHSQPAESHHTITHNTDIVIFFVSAGSEAMTLLHPHTLLRRMRGGEDDANIDDDT